MSRQVYPTQLRDHLGNEVRLPPKPFAVGGEGAVFDVQGRPDLVAKLYSKPQSKERCDKLRAMAKLCSPDLLKIAAWPTATLNVGNPAVVDGILMPKVADYLEIHHLYSVAQRKKDFPEVDWGFLLHTARNCTIAFETVHGHGHVVGDVNQKNVMVSKKGIVAFVDCDSFQVAEGSRIFRCGVGVPEYTPPELHGKNFASLDRAANHDLFGLAVLVFHLLMMGRHPFSGVPLVKADIPIEKAIQEGYYAYTRSTATARLKPPPHVPPVTMLDPSMLDLFDRAFGTARRPTAAEWRKSLDAAMSQLVRCKNDPRHSYMAASSQCPWCDLIATARLMFFLPSRGGDSKPFRPEDIQQIIQKLAGMEILFAPHTRPKPSLPVRVSLPAGLRAASPKPSLKPRPSPPPPVQLPASKSRPPAPSGAASPTLKPVPLPPVYPSLPPLSPPDPFLPRICIAAMIAGFVIIFIAKPVGFILMALFAAWWALMRITEKPRQERIRKMLKEDNQIECDRMDEEYAELCKPIEAANRRLMAAWKAANEAVFAEYERICREVDEEDRRRVTAWEAAKEARASEYDRSCHQIDASNRHVLAAWESANAPWVAEEKRWKQRLAADEAELNKLEADLNAQRSASQSRFQKRKKEADGIVSTHNNVRQDYDKEIRQAEVDSKKIQMEEHLDSFLIRHAKLKAITNVRILALDSFGIETAKDVTMLTTQKVPGIGPVLNNRLFAWRDSIEASFVPKQTLPESEKSRIASRYAPMLLPLGQSLQASIRDLEGIIGSQRTRERELLKAIGALVEDAAVVEAHLKALNNVP
jgi:DNA-binding helix-hairpin-helix protein with protein kinase domain